MCGTIACQFECLTKIVIFLTISLIRPRDPDPIEAPTEELIQIEPAGTSDSREFSESPPPPDDRDELIQQLLREVTTHCHHDLDSTISTQLQQNIMPS